MSDMTDREALLALLERFGLTPHEGDPETYPPGARAALERKVNLVAGHGGVEGYSRFEALFDFDADGKFQSLHIQE